MDTEAETAAGEAPARAANCVEAGGTAAGPGPAAEDSCPAARGSPQPAPPAQPPGDPAAAPASAVSNGEDAGQELVDLKIVWNKTKHDLKFPLDSTGSELKQKIHSITGSNGSRGSPFAPSSPRGLEKFSAC